MACRVIECGANERGRDAAPLERARHLAGRGGVSGGAHNGQRGYMLTYAIAYIRDFLTDYHIIGETYETTVPWSRIQEVCDAVAERATQVRIMAVAGPLLVEDANAPLSDVSLAAVLGQRGVKVARRTIAKYRTMMRVLPADLRRQKSRITRFWTCCGGFWPKTPATGSACPPAAGTGKS